MTHGFEKDNLHGRLWLKRTTRDWKLEAVRLCTRSARPTGMPGSGHHAQGHPRANRDGLHVTPSPRRRHRLLRDDRADRQVASSGKKQKAVAGDRAE